MEKIPDNMLDAFTMGGKIPIQNGWRDNKKNNKQLVWSKKVVDSYVSQANNNISLKYGETTRFLYNAFEDFSVRNKSILVIGSESPVYESILISRGANPITLEYRKISCNDPRICTLVAGIDTINLHANGILSISSIEHSGLGRYGDKLDPNGDINTMKECLSYVSPGDLFFISIPVSDSDALVWNAHRIYGGIRLPILLNVSNGMLRWNKIAEYGVKKKIKKGFYQPVFVLKCEELS